MINIYEKAYITNLRPPFHHMWIYIKKVESTPAMGFVFCLICIYKDSITLSALSSPSRKSISWKFYWRETMYVYLKLHSLAWFFWLFMKTQYNASNVVSTSFTQSFLCQLLCCILRIRYGPDQRNGILMICTRYSQKFPQKIITL